jgi:DNA processing protein
MTTPAAAPRPGPTLDEEREAWVVLASIDGIGELTFGRLVSEHRGAANVLARAREGRLSATPRPTTRDALRGTEPRPIPAAVFARLVRAARDPEAVTRRIEELGLWTLTPFDDAYPARLRSVDPPPAVLFGSGDRSALSAARSVAVVGTRRPTPYGRDVAARVATRLVECAAVVVSGLAVGIDGTAHAATVRAGGSTVAVIGGGHAQPGPRANEALLGRIVTTGGAVVSELAPDHRPTPGTFPRRNRIISGLADTTIVVEAPARSGALITARHSLEQGRGLLVAPGRPFDRSTAGCLALLRDTPARPLTGLDEMVVDLGYDAPAPGHETPARGRRMSRDAALALLGPAELSVARTVCRGPATVDDIVVSTGLAPATVAGAVTLLLLRGWAQAIGPTYLPAGPLLARAS